jgi:hypothetical protein
MVDPEGPEHPWIFKIEVSPCNPSPVLREAVVSHRFGQIKGPGGLLTVGHIIEHT